MGYGTNPEGRFRLKYGVPDLNTEVGRAEYKARANAVLENFFGPGTEITQGAGEITDNIAAAVVNGSLLVFGLGAGAESGFALVRGLTYTAEAGLSGYAGYDGVGNIYEGIQDGSVKQVAWGTFETATGALGGYGSVRALAGEIRAASGADLLVIDDALLDVYVAESLAPVAERNTLVVGASQRSTTAARGLPLPENFGGGYVYQPPRALSSSVHPIFTRLENVVAKFEGTYVQGGVQFPTKRAAQQAVSELLGDLGSARRYLTMQDYNGAPWYFKDSVKRIGVQSRNALRGFRDDFMGHQFGDGTYIPPHLNVWYDEFIKLHFFY
jgi:hypothetical protein